MLDHVPLMGMSCQFQGYRHWWETYQLAHSASTINNITPEQPIFTIKLFGLILPKFNLITLIVSIHVLMLQLYFINILFIYLYIGRGGRIQHLHFRDLNVVSWHLAIKIVNMN